MAIRFDEKNMVFNLSTPNTTYLFGLFRERALVHIYYGKKTDNAFNFEDVFEYSRRNSSSVTNGISYNDLPLEYPEFLSSDYRTPAFCAKNFNGDSVSRFCFKGYEILRGKPELSGLPSSYVEDDREADTLNITLYDDVAELELVLTYTVYNDRDIITRSVKVKNCGESDATISKVMSMSLDVAEGRGFDFVHLQGSWANERHIERTPVFNGGIYIDSIRGGSGHHHNPFMCLAKKNTTEFSGEAYGFGLVYSGNFIAGAEMNSEDVLRVYMGINDFNFSWTLEPETEFQSPEVIMTYSDCGFNKMSQNFHSHIRERLCRGKFRDSVRPVLINNWEGTYFDFNEEKILSIAKNAKDLGVELMVLDDGWFGKRDDDKSSLGDWYVNKSKLPDGIDGLAKKIEDMGMKFGLWVEPEMVSPDSNLYRAHPEWAIQVKDREPSLARTQLVLDLTREDVRQYIVDFMTDILSNAPISYIKWDMNRFIAEPASSTLPTDRQSEFSHRYMLGLYEVLETITSRFPDVLFEGCAGGGGRFDLGMLHYFPQYWTSDDTDAVERMYIQYGTSMLYPTSTMGAHVSAVPNHQVGRVTPLHTRGNIAMMGRFGYELDLATLTDAEKELVKEQIKDYKRYGEMIHKGTMYRLVSPFESNEFAVEFVSEDTDNVIVIFASILSKPNIQPIRLKLTGLDKKALYRDIDSGKVYGGDVLENIGIHLLLKGDFESMILKLEKCSDA